MQISLFKDDKILLSADVEFGLTNIIVNSVSSEKKNIPFLYPELFEQWMEDRAKKYVKGNLMKNFLFYLD